MGQRGGGTGGPMGGQDLVASKGLEAEAASEHVRVRDLGDWPIDFQSISHSLQVLQSTVP